VQWGNTWRGVALQGEEDRDGAGWGGANRGKGQVGAWRGGE